MTTVATIAENHPDRPAIIYGDGEHIETYGELEARSRRLGQLFRQAGLEPGDGVAVYLGNDDSFFDLFWACHRTGLYFIPVNWHLQEDEVAYIVDNCDAKALVANADFGDVAARVALQVPKLTLRLAVGGAIAGFEDLEAQLSAVPEDAPLENQLEGSVMLYSSGTTGRPKGVRRPLPRVPAGDMRGAIGALGMAGIFGMQESDVYLSPAPLYHAAPLVFTSAQHRLGATTVVMRRFDPSLALDLIEKYRVTSSQWVPTHFRRLLQIPEERRQRADVSSLRIAIHAAAPCPVPVKQAMIDWWGDAVYEYYAGTEGGGTLIKASEWLEHRGSVGRHWTGGKVYVLDEDGGEITAPDTEGAIYFEAPPDASQRFRYYKDDAKTDKTYRGDLFTLGDIGYLDGDGFLYLTDRQSNMIISGGVNIYPQETENHLITHPKVDEVAVIGVPNEEMGEEVKAVVVPAAGQEPGDALAQELIDFCRAGIAHYKCPRTIDFVDDLPRTETGKMAKRRLRSRYWEGHDGALV
ncbi:MAG: acyl-CoA synthetase [Proteobacteria bacterium]|nr:acyl-CoA synthetase [Pseudomonadota bacterium]